MTRGQGRDPDIHRPPADSKGDAAVLWQALFRDIELRHDLDPADQRGMQRALGPNDIAQGPIDPEPHQRE